MSGSGKRTGGARRAAARPSANDAGEIREWARGNGYEVSERGRISSQVREAYTAAH